MFSWRIYQENTVKLLLIAFFDIVLKMKFLSIRIESLLMVSDLSLLENLKLHIKTKSFRGRSFVFRSMTFALRAMTVSFRHVTISRRTGDKIFTIEVLSLSGVSGPTCPPLKKLRQDRQDVNNSLYQSCLSAITLSWVNVNLLSFSRNE